MREPLAVLENVVRTYRHAVGTRIVLRGVWARVLPGDRIALLGPSGSGKTTLLHLLAGLDEPTAGRVCWPALGNGGSLRPERIGVAFQGPSLLRLLPTVENVALPLLLSGWAEREARRRASQVLEALGLEDLARRLPEELSAGQAKRVAVARALVTRPRLVLLDEPTGHMDHRSAASFLDALIQLLDEASGLVVVTHDEWVAARLRTVWRLCAGRLGARA